MLIAARALALSSLALGFAWGCGDSGTSAAPDNATATDTSASTTSAEDGAGDDAGAATAVAPDAASAPVSDASSEPDAAASEDTDAKPELSLQQACEMACNNQAECIGLTDMDCATECAAQNKALTEHECASEGRAEMQCLGDLTCEQLRMYAEQGRRDHAQCGKQATAYFEQCAVGAGELAPGCIELCLRKHACQLNDISDTACAESCVLRATHLTWNVRPACGTGYLALAGCLANVPCEQLAAMLDKGTVPTACAQRYAAQKDSCD